MIFVPDTQPLKSVILTSIQIRKSFLEYISHALTITQKYQHCTYPSPETLLHISLCVVVSYCTHHTNRWGRPKAFRCWNTVHWTGQGHLGTISQAFSNELHPTWWNNRGPCLKRNSAKMDRKPNVNKRTLVDGAF